METPSNISNEAKWKRGILELQKKNKELAAQNKPLVEINEEAVKALYLAHGGLIIGDPSTQQGVDEGEISFAVMTEPEKVEAAKKPRKRR